MNKTSMRLAVLAVAIAPSMVFSEPVNLKVTNGLSPTHVVSVEGIERWMTCVTERSGGEMTFDYYPGGQISTVKDTAEALGAGLADIGFVSSPNEVSKLPLNGIVMLPNGGKDAVEVVKSYRASIDAGSPLATELTNLGLHPFLLSSLAPYQVMLRSKRVESLEDFANLKLRVSGGPMTFTAMSLNAVPTEMPAGDLYIALERGTVDGTILSLSSVKTYSLQELVTQISSNARLGTSAQLFAFRQVSWDALSPEHQKAATDCGLEVEDTLARHIDKIETELKQEFAEMGIAMTEFSSDELQKIDVALAGAVEQYLQRLEDRGLPARAAYESLSAPPAN